ncbi:MAG: M1 family metallopeptidase, partial [Acidimicrobiia bacterium]
MTEADHRLPRDATPRHYDLRFEPDLETATFSGVAEIDLDVHRSGHEVVLNAVELELNGVAATSAGGDVVAATRVTLDADRGRATLRFDEALAAGRWRLRIGFEGILNDQLQGFYRSTYTAADGTRKTIATTQLESTDARRAFPCWDEPDLKATFGVTLVVREGLTAVSNGPVVSERPAPGGKVEVTFADTMVMSTYLVAMIVGEFEATEPVDVDGVPLRIVHVPGMAHLTPYALDVGAFALRFFSDYYGIAYPAEKLDMIGIPDFAWGAMENLGAITYREADLLVDPATATQAEQARVADVIAHEIAHMWFGDLVTMKWWNGVWLNEAFASLMETKCVDAYRPDWKRWLAFSATRAHSMDIDALESTRAIELPVGSPEEANEMFDALTYGKGQAVLRMLEVYLGEDVFRKGIAAYLKRHAYANTETADLWAALEGESGEPVGEIMHEWIYRGGFPRLTVEPEGSGYRVTQEHFRYLGEAGDTWLVPALYGSGGGDDRLLIGSDTTVAAEAGFLLNRRGQGFYRVRYGPSLFADVVARFPGLDPEERYAVVSDTWANVLRGDVAAADFVDLAGRLGEEAEPAVWGVALGAMSELDRVVSSDARPWLQGVVRELTSPIADRMGWEPDSSESDLTRQLRGRMISAAGALGEDETVRAIAAEVFERWLAARDEVDGEVGAAALAVTAHAGDLDLFQRLVGLHEAASSPQDQIRFLRAAMAIPEPEAAREVLAMVLDGRVRRQDSPWVLAGLIGHRDTGPGTWAAMKDVWEEVVAAPPPQTARRILDHVPFRSEPVVAEDIAGWLAAHPIAGADKYTAQQLERMRVRVGLRARESGRLG